MDHSLLTARLNTHLKIVGVALVLATGVVLVVVNAKTSDIATAGSQTIGDVVKAGRSVGYAGHGEPAVR
jgi:hypothetical protein